MKNSVTKCPFSRNKSKAFMQFFDKGRFLVPFSEIGKEYDHEILTTHRKKIFEIDSYIKNFISKENKELGRKGVVCPYTPGALQRDNLYFTICNNDLSNIVESKELILDYMELFLKLKPCIGSHRIFKAIIILFPEVNSEYAEVVVERMHKILKPIFVENGLMLGQFYQSCHSPGIHNLNFKALQSPIPLFVIRYMVKNDYLFLDDFQEAYFNNFPKDHDPSAVDYFSNLRNGASSA